MSSDISKEFRKAVKEYTDEIAEQENERIRTALNKTMVRVNEKLKKIIKEYMLDNYYKGYDPYVYNRTFQLGYAVSPYTEMKTVGSTMGFVFGINLNPEKMDHSKLKITARWYNKRKKKEMKKTYEYDIGKSLAREERILYSYFQSGVHPNANARGVTETPTITPIFTDDREGHAPDAIEEWVNGGGIIDIFNEELKKLLN